MVKQVHILISGSVQGVSFRYYTKQKADELHINGWVRNTDDGKVEIVAQGNESDLNRFIEWCPKGPQGAKVDEIETELQSPEKVFNKFAIIS